MFENFNYFLGCYADKSRTTKGGVRANPSRTPRPAVRTTLDQGIGDASPKVRGKSGTSPGSTNAAPPRSIDVAACSAAAR